MSKESYLKPSVLGVGAVIEKDDRFLMVEEAKTMKEIGKEEKMFSFPSGFVEQYETPVEALMREVPEGTGFSIEVVDIIGFYIVKGAVGIAFRAEITGGELRASGDGSDIKSANWYPPDKVRRMNLRPAILQILEDYILGQSYPLEIFTDARGN
ncbi:MAG: NUDIX domain-containing protein [Candidatus Dojkabacteria bacterium]